MVLSLNKGRLLLAIFISFTLWIVINQYLFCPSFLFDSSQPFSGASFYNPYDSINAYDWKKCNFHAHTNAWHGITHGSGTAKDVYHVYDSMNYVVHCVSDYQSINKMYANSSGYIPAYEHGYNTGKTHQLVLGSEKVKWIDYFFPQSLNNKQDVLNHLVGPENVVIVNHPSSFHSYNASDFRYLTNYNCMEVLSPYAISIACWDTALSNGKPVFIVGNDDEHNIFSKNSVGRMCTYINASSIDQKTVLNALKKGKGYGVRLGNFGKQLPVLNSLKLKGDTMLVEMSDPADQISFIGQNGKLLAKNKNTISATYIIKPEDRYVRTVIDYGSGTSIFLNPVFRYNKAKKMSTSFQAKVYTTNIKRILGLSTLAFWLRIAIPFIFSKSYQTKPQLESLRLQSHADFNS
jgi:hypothetical protein